MHYEINVSFRGKHYFATAARSLTTAAEAQNALEHFRRVFPQSEGYEVTCTRYETVGRDVTAEFAANLEYKGLSGPLWTGDPRCPGCGCKPGDGVTPGCAHPEGCGFFNEDEAVKAATPGRKTQRKAVR